MRRLSAVPLALTALALAPAAALAQDSGAGTGSPNLQHVKTFDYGNQYAAEGELPNYGTDIEFVRLRGRTYAIAGSEFNGLRIVDVTRGGKEKVTAFYDCAILQGDVQVFKAGDGSNRTLVSYTADSGTQYTKSRCHQDAAKRATSPDNNPIVDADTGKQGTFLVDISDPRKPKTISFIPVPQGSHNMTVHPSGKYLYNSNSDLMTSTSPAIEIIDIRKPDFPVKLPELKLLTSPGLGTESHDITFNEAGTRAYVAALSHGEILDTTDPANPKTISTFDDEAINVWHQSDPVTLKDKAGKTHELLIAEDEFAGAAGGPFCPSGGVHVYDVTGENEKDPVKLGYWNIQDFAGPTHNPAGSCTAHVFDVHENEQLMTIAFYNGGVRVVDLAGLADGQGMKAIAAYKTDDADSWSFKAPRVSRTGVFYAYGNDIERGFDVYRFDGSKAKSDAPGTWLPTPALETPAAPAAPAVPAVASSRASVPATLAGYRMRCLIK